MSARIEEWLERMRKSENPGPVARVTAARNGREVGWIFDVSTETHLGDLAERIDNACRDAGFAGTYELRAVDADGHFIAPLAHKAQVAEIVPMGGGLPPMPMGVEESIGASLPQRTGMVQPHHSEVAHVEEQDEAEEGAIELAFAGQRSADGQPVLVLVEDDSPSQEAIG